MQAATTVRGAFIRSIDIASAHNNCGLAVNEDESVLAASSLNDGAVYLYRLPDGALLLTISDLEMPEKLCFVPKSCGGGLLVPESRRRCLKLYSEAGEFLRRIGEAEITHPIVGVATNGAVVAVGKGKEQSGPQILMFDLATGAHIRSFAGRGSANGEVHSCVGLRFTPDGAHLAVSEFRNDRISIFTIAGVFVRCITHPCIRAPEDVDFALNGDMLIAAHGSNSIVVLSPNGSVVLNEIKSVEGQFSLRMPMSLAYSKSTRRLYAIGAVTKVLCFE